MAYGIDPKRLLSNALYDLMQEKKFEKITVENIIKKAGVSKATFYRYFQDKFDLMCWFYKDFVATTFDEVYSKTSWYRTQYIYAEFYKNNKSFFINIYEYDGQNSFDKFLYEYCLNFFRKLIKKNSNADISKELEFAIRMYCYGNSFIVRDWLKNEISLTIDEFCEYRYNSMPKIMKDVLEMRT